MQLTLLPTALLALLPVASAGYSYGGSSGASPSTGNSAAAQNSGTPAAAAGGVTVINVGQNPLKMEPNDVTVPQGGIIEFRFFTGAHSVAQSAFDSPCTPLNATAANGAEGFFSGSQAVSSGQGPNVFRVTSTGSPMWYYCATGRHCQDGMVGVINKPYVFFSLFLFSLSLSPNTKTDLQNPEPTTQHAPSSCTPPPPPTPRRTSPPPASRAANSSPPPAPAPPAPPPALPALPLASSATCTSASRELPWLSLLLLLSKLPTYTLGV